MSETENAQRDFALEVVRRLRDARFEALWAGGCVRDQLLGLTPKDYDVATNARPEQVRDLFGRRRTLSVGAAFGVVAVLGGRSRAPIEVATFRSDGDYLDGRHPASVAYTDAEHDAQRRDFTINGLFFDPVASRVIDYVSGQRDLADGVVRAIGDPRRRFEEDKLRMLRAVRFAATFDFRVESATLDAIREMASDVQQVSAERIGAELMRVLESKHRRRGVQLLATSGLLPSLLPELTTAASKGEVAWLEKLARLDRLQSSSAPVAMALLLEGETTADEAKQICRRFRLTNTFADRTAWLLRRLGDARSAATMPWPQLQRLLIHDGAADLVAALAAIVPDGDAGLARCREKLALSEEVLNPPPLVTGSDLIANGLPTGPHFSQLLSYLRDLQLEGRLATSGEAIAEAKRWYETHHSSRGR